MTGSNFTTNYKRIKGQIDHQIDSWGSKATSRLEQAAFYALSSGGKRLRPMLYVCLHRALAGDHPDKLTAQEQAVALALEMTHVASLIHDDLPELDNDNYRHGKPTCHRQFDHATALLAGDYLNAQALLELSACPPPTRLAILAGAQSDIALGQALDLDLESGRLPSTQETLTKLNRHKTGSLFATCIRQALVGLSADILSTQDQARLTASGYNLGLAFQIQDDVGDFGAGQTTPNNWATLVGRQQAVQDYHSRYSEVAQIWQTLLPAGPYRDFLFELVTWLASRESN